MGGLTDVQTITVTVKDVDDNTGGGKSSRKGGGGSSTNYVCKDSKALNFSSKGTHKQSLCEYPEVNYVCRDTKATNYSAEGTHKQSVCKYGDEKDEKDDKNDPTKPTSEAKKLGYGKKCPSNMWLHDNMKRGDRNGKYSSYNKGTVSEVKILQPHMNRLGFRSGPEDGIFGPLTDGAVKRMQAFLGTRQDGIVGPITRSLLNYSCKDEEKEEPVLDVKQCPHFTTYYKKGQKGGEITKIQIFLKEQGLYNGPIDGIYGNGTDAGIRAFQSKYASDILAP
jgi:hypothetical protein